LTKKIFYFTLYDSNETNLIQVRGSKPKNFEASLIDELPSKMSEGLNKELKSFDDEFYSYNCLKEDNFYFICVTEKKFFY